MSKVIIMTDSNSGITQTQAKEMGVVVLPMPFYINEEMFYEDIDLSQEQFYEKLQAGGDIKTSMPLVGDVTDKWDELLKEYDEVVYIPMSSGLSSSCETAYMLSQDYDGKVEVVNNQRISVTMRQSVIDAKNLAEAGKSAKEIKDILEAAKFDSSIYIMVDTLTYLKKGGRITPAAAALGTLLKLKPVLQIQGEKLDAFADPASDIFLYRWCCSAVAWKRASANARRAPAVHNKFPGQSHQRPRQKSADTHCGSK